MSLMFTQGHRVTEKLELVQSFCCKVAFVGLFGCLMFQQHASVSQEWSCTDNFSCCHTEIEIEDQTFYLTQSHYTDTRLTGPSTDPIIPGAWQGSPLECHFLRHWYDSTRKNPIVRGIRTPDLPFPRRTP